MRIRKIKDKDACAATVLLRHFGVAITDDELAQRLHHFQYKRNHVVVGAIRHGMLVSLMHIGIEPSLVADRTARVYALFVEQDNEAVAMTQSLLKYGEDWARQHGCQMVYDDAIKPRLSGCMI